jgi:transcriptional regulator with XRE-family HTH domain
MSDMDKRSPVMPVPPGELLRALRQKNGWTLRDVSERTGLTVSTLSKVEHGKMSLTYDKMMRIATGLGIDIGVLFAAPTGQPDDARARPRPAGGRRSITRRGEGRLIESRNFIQQYPAAELLHKQLVPIIVEVKARSRAEFGQLLGHAGEEFVLVIEGRLELHTELYEPVVLEKGDSIYFDSSMAHGYVAAGSERCSMLSVCSTAEWGGQATERSAARHTQSPLEPQIIRAS